MCGRVSSILAGLTLLSTALPAQTMRPEILGQHGIVAGGTQQLSRQSSKELAM